MPPAPPFTEDILTAISLGWLMLLIIAVALVIFSRRHFRAWMILPPLLAFPLSFVWWNLWMYDGWTGPPRVFISLLPVDGEAAYDATQFDMMLFLCCVLLFVAWLFAHLCRRIKCKQRLDSKP